MRVSNRQKTEQTEQETGTPDEGLVALLIKGDFPAYGQLIRRHRLLVNKLTFTLTGGDGKRAAELAVAMLLVLWTERDKVKDTIPFPCYLLELAVRLHKRSPPFLSDN